MIRPWTAAALVLSSAALAGCVAKVPIEGARCPCPTGYCCENDVCVPHAVCGPPDGAGTQDTGSGGLLTAAGGAGGGGGAGGNAGDRHGEDGGGGGAGGGRDAGVGGRDAGVGGQGNTSGAPGRGDAGLPDHPVRDAASGADAAGDMHDAGEGGSSTDGSSTDGSSRDGGGPDGAVPGGAGHVVQPWVGDAPSYARAVVRIGTCSGTLVDWDWVLTSRRCGTQFGDRVSSVRPSGTIDTTVDRIVDDWASQDDAEYLHVAQPFSDVPLMPLYWGTTAAVLGHAITCYGYSGNDLWVATLSTRPHADVATDPNTFETARSGADTTLLPGGPGGPCVFQDRLAAVDSGWLSGRSGGLETSLPEFRSWMVGTMRGQRNRLFQVVGTNDLFLLDTSQQLWHEDASGANRVLVDQAVRTFQAVDPGTVYVLGVDSNVWRETPDMSDKSPVDGTTAVVYGVDASEVYILGRDLNLWRETGNLMDRTWVDGSIMQFDTVGGWRVFVLGTDRNLWNEDGDWSNRTLMDSGVISLHPMTDSTAYVLRDDFSLWHEVGTYATASMVDQNVWDFQGIDDKLVYVLDQAGTLWRERGSAADRDRVDDGVVRFQALDATTVYVLGEDGALWREQGSSSSRVQIDHR